MKMKNSIKTSLVLAALLSSTVGFSNDTIITENKITNPVTNMSFDYVKKGAKLYIKDANGYVLYTYPIKSTGSWSKSFDLTNLPDGEYYFELDKNAEIVITPFKVDSNLAEVQKDKEVKIAKPQFIVKDNHVYLSKMSMDKKITKIDVYYEGSELAYSEKLKDTKNLNRVYDFSKSLKGDYIIQVNSEGKTFSERVNVGTIY
jgi:hypothetical protein